MMEKIEEIIVPDSGIKKGNVGKISTVIITCYLILFSIFLLYSLVQFWPTANASPVTFLLWTFSISDETHSLLIVAIAGALGSLVHVLRSFYWYVGNRELIWSWVAKYILLPFVGTAIGLVFYLIIRGGFFSPQAGVQQTSPFGFAALAALAGLFSEQAILKLQKVAETLLTEVPAGADSKPQKLETEGRTKN